MKECCVLHRQLRNKWKGFFGAMYSMIGGNPRLWNTVYNHLREELSTQEMVILLSDECPCKQGRHKNAI